MKNNFFSVMVIGENPEQIMEEFNLSLKVPKYLKYKIEDSHTLHKNAVLTTEKFIDEMMDNPTVLEYLHTYLSDIKDMTDIEFFAFLTKDLEHDEEGNAWDTLNPNGKWVSYQLGKNNSIPLIKHNGEEVFQCKKGEVDWKKMHLHHTAIYKRTWEMIVENQEPKHDADKIMQGLMADKKDYLLNFKNKDNYIKYNSSYWNYAVIKNNVWNDADNKPSFEWVVNFYTTFVEPLDDNELITIYEYQIENAND